MKHLKKIEFVAGIAVLLFASLGMYFSDTQIKFADGSRAEVRKVECALPAPKAAEVESAPPTTEPTPAKNEPTLAPLKFVPPQRGHVISVQVEVGQ